MKTLLSILATCLSMLVLTPSALSTGGLYGNAYVKSTATGLGNGSSWTDAYTSLQEAIDKAIPGDVICVAQGTYLPTHILGDDTLRNRTFYINKSIVLYGGFIGDPGTEGSFEERNPGLYVTTLSGDVGVAGVVTDNAFHVVYFDHVSDSTHLDGFVIADGNSINGGGFNGTGAGIFNNATAGRSHPVIANCIIRHNEASENAGGMLNQAGEGGHANPRLTNCSFIQNEGGGGGAFSNYTDTEGEANPVFINCIFKGNIARSAGGGVMNVIAHSAISGPVLINCVMTGNHSPFNTAIQGIATGNGASKIELINCTMSGNSGGAIRVVDLGEQKSAIKIRNSIIYGNAGGAGITSTGAMIDAAFSVIPFGFPGENIFGLDPGFVSQPPLDSANIEGDVHLQENSLAIEAGRNEDVPAAIQTDLDKKPRFINHANGEAGIVDIGAYEVQHTTTSVEKFLSHTAWDAYPNPANDKLTVSLADKMATGQLRMLDAHGRLVSFQNIETGSQNQTVDVSKLPAGIYFVCLIVNDQMDVRKITIQ